MQKIKTKTMVIYFLLTLTYFFSYFFRVSTSVVLPQLQTEWMLSPTIIGFISSMYFYTYAIMQPFCGVLNDKYGPLKIVGFGIIITTIGSLLFGLGSTVTSLIIGRLLMGIGLSPMLSGLLVFQGRSFDSKNYTFFSGLSMMIGNFGAVASVAPLSFALSKWGRNSVFTTLSISTIVIAVLLFVIQKATQSKEESSENFITILKTRLSLALRTVGLSRELKLIIFDWLIIFGGLMAFQGLWAVSWFKNVYPNQTELSSIAATMVGIGVMGGNFFGGNICKNPEKRNTILKIFTLLNFVCWLIMIICFNLHAPIYFTIISSTILGIINGILFVQFTAAVNEISPVGQGGAVFGITNFCIFTSVIIFQWGTGVIIEKLKLILSNDLSFLFTFTIVTTLMIIPLIITLRMKQINRVNLK